jgi:outer membrane protein W
MIKKVTAVAAILGMCLFVWADDPSEKGVPTSPLTIYSGGFGVGASHPLNDELKAEQSNYLKLSLVNTVFFKDNIAVFFDADWFAPGGNFGADLGFDFVIANSGGFRPFIGAGIGAHYFDKGNDFGDDFGPSGTAHIGFALDLSDRVQMRVRVPYHLVGGETQDHLIGLDVGFLFSNKFRNVKKLDYNKM